VCTWRSGGRGIFYEKASDKPHPPIRAAPAHQGRGDPEGFPGERGSPLCIKWPAVGWVVLGISYAVGGPLLAVGLYIVLRGAFPGWWMEWMLWPVKRVTPGVARLQGATVIGLGASIASRTGNLAFDPSNPNYLYQIFAYATVADASDPNALLHAVGIAVSSDGGLSWQDHNIYVNPNADTRHYDNQFPNVTVDKAGNVYAFYSDDRNTYYSYSADHGQSWQGPIQVNRPGETAIFPWATAGDAGKVDVVYYKTPWLPTDPANPTPAETAPPTAAWTVGFAQNLTAVTPASTFNETTAGPTVHRGSVCQGGAACTGNRDLYDDFGVAASPTTGLASIIYSDDQFTNEANSPARPGCTAAQSNTPACDHTSIATQTAGPVIFGTKK